MTLEGSDLRVFDSAMFASTLQVYEDAGSSFLARYGVRKGISGKVLEVSRGIVGIG